MAGPAAHDHAVGAGADRATGGPAAPGRVLPAAPTASVRATPTASVRATPTASVRAAPRRAVGHAPFRLGDLALDPEQRRVTVAGRRVDLTATEYALLRALSADAGGVSTADALLRRVWGGPRAGGPNLLRTFVRRLRGKLGDDPGRPAHIITERGVGYRLAAPRDGYREAGRPRRRPALTAASGPAAASRFEHARRAQGPAEAPAGLPRARPRPARLTAHRRSG